MNTRVKQPARGSGIRECPGQRHGQARAGPPYRASAQQWWHWPQDSVVSRVSMTHVFAAMQLMR